MELEIVERRWAVNRVTGQRKENVTARVTAPCIPGVVKGLGNERKYFTIDEVTDENLTLTIHYTANPAADTSFVLEREDSRTYAPVSFGAGYIYHFTWKAGTEYA